MPDTTLLAKTKQELEHQATCIEVHSTLYGLKIHTKKTNVMTVNETGNLVMGDKFKYLGWISRTEDLSICEIRASVVMDMVKSMMSSVTAVWTSMKIS